MHKALNVTPQSGQPDYTKTEAAEANFIMVKTSAKGSYTKVDVDDIFYVEGLKNYVSIYTAKHRVVPLLNIKDLEQQLPASKFVRTHKSYIVNIFRIQNLEGNQILLSEMTHHQKQIPIGTTYKETFFQKIDRYIMVRR